MADPTLPAEPTEAMIEVMASAINDAEPKPPGPCDPPFGSPTLHPSVWEPERRLARAAYAALRRHLEDKP